MGILQGHRTDYQQFLQFVFTIIEIWFVAVDYEIITGQKRWIQTGSLKLSLRFILSSGYITNKQTNEWMEINFNHNFWKLSTYM